MQGWRSEREADTTGRNFHNSKNLSAYVRCCAAKALSVPRVQAAVGQLSAEPFHLRAGMVPIRPGQLHQLHSCFQTLHLCQCCQGAFTGSGSSGYSFGSVSSCAAMGQGSSNQIIAQASPAAVSGSQPLKVPTCSNEMFEFEIQQNQGERERDFL